MTLPHRVSEILLYTLLNSVPYHICAIYPFRSRLRWSLPVCLIPIVIATAFEAFCNFAVGFGYQDNSSVVTILSSAVYIICYCIIIQAPIGKVAFYLLMLVNVCNFNMVVGKCIEGYLFPQYAMERFHLSSCLTLFVTESIVLAPMSLIILKYYTPALSRKNSGFLWYWLWLVPAIFYFLWYHHIHFTSESSLEVATDIHSVGFLFFINCGACLIYYIVLQLVNQSANNAELRSHNHQLTLQTLQYENLQERIAATRKANHDLRHHVAAMSSYLEKEDYVQLRKYFDTLRKHLPFDGTMMYCRHNTINTLLTYFSQLASLQDTEYVADVQVPADLSLPDTDLAVLLGNLLENAVEACALQTTFPRKIMVCGRTEGDLLLFTIDNTFSLPPKTDRYGVLVSSKHTGNGIGVESSRSIVLRHGGEMTVNHHDGLFCVSIVIPI